jgi:flagellar protein FlaG
MSTNLSVNRGVGPGMLSGGSLVDGRAMPTQPVTPAKEAAVQLAINPLPVLHAPAKDNSDVIEQNIKVAIEQINNVLKDGGRGLSFVLDPAVNRPIVKVMREDTGEVIRQYPNEAVVRVAHSIEKLKGVLFEGLI